jgi:hypothetical protein
VNTKPGDSELFEWKRNQWVDSETNIGYIPLGTKTNIPLKTRSTSWKDVDVSWVSNFGIFVPSGNSLQEHVINNRYVSDAVVPLNTYFQQTSGAADSNVVIGNNTGTITSIPRAFRIPFSDSTFGVRIVDESEATPFIAYRQTPDNAPVGSEVIFKALVNSTAYSYGASGQAEDIEEQGRLKFISWDSLTKTGVLEYTKTNLVDYHYSRDVSGEFSSDKILVTYLTNNEKLDEVIDWEVIDVYRAPDGYTDPRKVKVVPRDVDGDLIPERPLQFHEYVGINDLVLFENYTDFDGYIYDRPVQGVILDYRGETRIRYQAGLERISPDSYDDFADLTAVDWIIVDNKDILNILVDVTAAAGIVVYAATEKVTYQFVPESTNVSTIPLVPTQDYFVKPGRGQTQNTLSQVQQDGVVRWRHIAPNDVRIDPSISNVVEMTLLTSNYYDEVRRWQARPTTEFPASPTSNQLSSEFARLNTYKSASDTLAFQSARFKLLFGNQAANEYQARFRVVKLSDNMSDNELKTKIISTINDYFDVDNWEFGETFYFTELATYIHQRLGSSIGSIVILPKNLSGTFGEMFQVKADSNELFISTASVSDIEIVSRLDNQTLRVDR